MNTLTINPTRIPYKVMRLAIAGLRAATLAVVSTLDAKQLTPDQNSLVGAILIANEQTAKRLKHSPTRAQMLVLCGAWDYFSEQALTLLPEGELADKLKAVREEAAWIRELDPNMKLKEVKP